MEHENWYALIVAPLVVAGVVGLAAMLRRLLQEVTGTRGDVRELGVKQDATAAEVVLLREAKHSIANDVHVARGETALVARDLTHLERRVDVLERGGHVHRRRDDEDAA